MIFFALQVYICDQWKTVIVLKSNNIEFSIKILAMKIMVRFEGWKGK